MTQGHKVIVKKDAANGEPISKSSESYENKQHAVEQAYALNGDVDDVQVDDAG